MRDNFDEWWEKSGHGDYWNARLAWIAAQHAERKRIIQIILKMHGLEAANLIVEIDK